VAEPTPEQQTGQAQGRRKRRVAEPTAEQQTDGQSRRIPLDRVNGKLAAQMADHLVDQAQQIAMLQVLAEDLQEENDKLRAELVTATSGPQASSQSASS
jgi:hypothetical protein